MLVPPELASVLATIITRLRERNGGTVPLVSRYDHHERTFGPMLPHLFQRRTRGHRNEVIGYSSTSDAPCGRRPNTASRPRRNGGSSSSISRCARSHSALAVAPTARRAGTSLEGPDVLRDDML
jgi:hypothetical protein